MLKAFLQQRRLKAAARLYQRRLGPQLRKDYGAGEYYTVGQIKASVLRAKLNAENIVFGYAGFLPEADFQALAPGHDYHGLRAMLRSYAASGSVNGGFEPAPESDGVTSLGLHSAP